MKPIVYDGTTAERCQNLVDVLTPQETADLMQTPVKDGDVIYNPTTTEEAAQCQPFTF